MKREGKIAANESGLKKQKDNGGEDSLSSLSASGGAVNTTG